MGAERHPKGLYVLFFAEMWERFSFYSMLALFTLYLRNPEEGFGWSAEEATTLYSNYLMFVYASPLIGGWLADKKLGYRRSVMIGGLFFIAGHLLLAFPSLAAVYAALTCLVIGNGFFKPNVSTMVGNLYPEGSPLKDRAYNIFYMGINIGAFLGPVVVEFMKKGFGYHPAFAVAAFGMVISVSILWFLKSYIAAADLKPSSGGDESGLPAAPQRPIDAVPEWQRIAGLLVVFAIVIVFWMLLMQGGSTLTYWADENTNWQVSGTISNAINPFWIIALTFPLVWFWKLLDRKGLEPSTPTKMVFGMFLSGASFFVLYAAAKVGEATVEGDDLYKYKVSPLWLIGAYGVLTLGELLLSPMGLSLVSKVAPRRMRGLMMGAWFVATALGNKLTVVGVFWDRWLHSSFFAVLGASALVVAFILLALLRPLKKAMPGV
jgi:POT family proton-dependent oligopeptide transporter